VQDNAGLKDTETVTITIPAKRKVTVTALGDGTGEALNAPLASALVKVYKAGVLKAQGYTTAAGAFTTSQIIEPGSVTITITKSGKIFNCNGTGSGTNVPVTNITLLTDGSVACTY
jgi:hypothetical protein